MHAYADLLELADAAEIVSDQPRAADVTAVETPAGTATQPGAASQPGATPANQEAPDDPHRLARVNLERYATRNDGRTLRYWREEWYVWKGHRYQRIAERELRAKITASVKEEFDRLAAAEQAAFDENPRDGQEPPVVRKVTMSIVSNVMHATASMTCLSGDTEPNTWLPTRERKRYVSLTNGILDIDKVLADADESECLVQNTPAWFSMTSLPYAFDSQAKCPRWEAFLEHNLELDPERIKVAQEWAGYLLLPDTSEQKFLVLIGEGANGKSVYTAGITALLGMDNVSTVPLEKFGDRFSLATSLGKLLNACGDCGEVDKAAEGDLKSFTAGDRMFFDRKGISGITCYPTARLMLACNNRPRFTDRSDGVWRRMLPMPWRVQIEATRRIRGMDKVQWWQDSGELPGILNWAIVGLARLRAQGAFTRSKLMDEEMQDYKEEMNPAKCFLQDYVERSADGRIRSAMLYGFYSKWAKENGYHPLSERSFGKEVRRMFTGVDRKLSGSRNERYWVYQGITFSQDEVGGESTHDALLF